MENITRIEESVDINVKIIEDMPQDGDDHMINDIEDVNTVFTVESFEEDTNSVYNCMPDVISLDEFYKHFKG